MFEFQTAMSELTGLPVSNAGLYEGPSSVASAGYLAIGATGRRRFVVSRGVHPHSRETLATYSAGFGAELVEVGLEDGRHRRRRARRRGRRRDRRRLPAEPQLPRRGRGRRGARRRRQGARRPAGRRGRPDDARHPQAARRVRRRHRPRRGPAARQPARLRRPLVRLLLRHRGADPPHARPDRRRDRRRRRPPRLRPRAADPRAAHPPREGDQQHLHRPGAERAGGDGPSRLAGAARASASWASCWPSAPPTRASDWRPSTGVELLHEAPVVREFAVRLDAPVERVLERCAERGIAAGYPLGREYPEYEDGLLVAITERRTREQIDDLADALGAAIAEPSVAPLIPDSDAKAPEAGGRASMTPATETPMQRERAVTIFEKSKPGRRAAVAARRRGARAAPRGADPGQPAARRAAAPARGRRAGDRPPLQPALAPQLRPRHAASTRSAPAR